MNCIGANPPVDACPKPKEVCPPSCQCTVEGIVECTRRIKPLEEVPPREQFSDQTTEVYDFSVKLCPFDAVLFEACNSIYAKCY